MNGGLRLDGTMIPRRVKRMFDQRSEARAPSGATALIEWRGTTQAVTIANTSVSGAMVHWRKIPPIGDSVVFQQPDRAPHHGVIRWVRDGRVGIHFTVTGK